jgi:hypothetical protein
MGHSAEREAGLSVAVLRDLPEGAVIITAGVAWAKIGPAEWRSPFREHVPDMSISPRWRGRFRWHDEKDSEWLAEVATRVVYDPRVLPPAEPGADRG